MLDNPQYVDNTVPSGICYDLVVRDEALHTSLVTADLADNGATALNDQDEPTNWVPACYKYRDSMPSYCTANIFTSATSFNSDMEAACLTSANYTNNHVKPICQR